MAEPVAVPEFRVFSPTKRVDVLLADWKAELAPDRSAEELERELYKRALSEYLQGDFGFGLWCWFECDRLTNAFGGRVAEVTGPQAGKRTLGKVLIERKVISREQLKEAESFAEARGLSKSIQRDGMEGKVGW